MQANRKLALGELGQVLAELGGDEFGRFGSEMAAQIVEHRHRRDQHELVELAVDRALFDELGNLSGDRLPGMSVVLQLRIEDPAEDRQQALAVAEVEKMRIRALSATTTQVRASIIEAAYPRSDRWLMTPRLPEDLDPGQYFQRFPRPPCGLASGGRCV